MVVRGLGLYGNPHGILRAFANEVATCKILGPGLNARVDLRMDGNLVCHVTSQNKTTIELPDLNTKAEHRGVPVITEPNVTVGKLLVTQR
jgi:hypothetical protein